MRNHAKRGCAQDGPAAGAPSTATARATSSGLRTNATGAAAVAGSSTITRSLLPIRLFTTGPANVFTGASPYPAASLRATYSAHSAGLSTSGTVAMSYVGSSRVNWVTVTAPCRWVRP